MAQGSSKHVRTWVVGLWACEPPAGAPRAPQQIQVILDEMLAGTGAPPLARTGPDHRSTQGALEWAGNIVAFRVPSFRDYGRLEIAQAIRSLVSRMNETPASEDLLLAAMACELPASTLANPAAPNTAQVSFRLWSPELRHSLGDVSPYFPGADFPFLGKAPSPDEIKQAATDSISLAFQWMDGGNLGGPLGKFLLKEVARAKARRLDTTLPAASPRVAISPGRL